MKNYSIDDIRRLAGLAKWKPYLNNPILTIGEDGAWDGWTLATMNILKVNDIYHMYYEAGCRKVDDFQMGHATSLDGINWVKDIINPIIPFGEPGSFDESATWDPFVIYEDGIFKMWYGGTAMSADGWDYQMGYCESLDGSNFTNRCQISHFTYAKIHGNHEGRGNVADMHVAKNPSDNNYYMYYLARGANPSGLFCAISSDEKHFDFDNAQRIEIKGEVGDYRNTHVFYENNKWHMFYGYKFETRTGYATSDDGLNWETKKRNVFLGDDAEILKIEDKLYLMYYLPGEYNLGHEAGCDIRVAIFKGDLCEQI
jgi:hypothetical protein